jgi:transposase
VEILRRARLEGYAGGKSALFQLVASLRPHHVRVQMRFEGLPGEFSQHDFGQVKVRYIDGNCRIVHFFASRLKWSRWVEVSLVDNEVVETLVRKLAEHFTRFGGVPLCAVFDRPKTVALSWREDGQVTEWNPTFAYAALELGFTAEVCWPHQPRQKGSVENLVGWVKGSFFKQRRFHDEEDLAMQLAQWLQETNTQRPCRATGVIPQERMAEDRKRLRPLRIAPSELALRIPVQVGPTAEVFYDGRGYAMPPEAAGLPGRSAPSASGGSDSRKSSSVPGTRSRTFGTWSMTRGISVRAVKNISAIDDGRRRTRTWTGLFASGAISMTW